MTGGQRRPSFDLIKEESAFLTSSERLKQQKRQDNELAGTGTGTDNGSSLKGGWTKSAIREEARLFLELAGVSTMMNLGFISSPLLTASYVGRRFAPVYLSAFTLANLAGNLSTFSLMAGLFSASDTLSPQAFGRGDFPEVGKIAIRGCVAAFALLLPINVFLFFQLENSMIALGQDPEASRHASQWYKVFVFTLPFSILFNSLWKFLTAQHIIKPLILVSVLCVCVILPLSLELCIGTMGFVGSAVGYVIFQASQALLLLLYVWWQQPHEAGTWSGLSLDTIASAVEWNQMKKFLYLGMGGIVAQCEWIFWEAIGLVIGQLGVVPLSVHTIPNQTIMAFCMVPFSFGVAMAIRMGNSLPISVERTQTIVLATSAASTMLFGLFSIGVYYSRDAIVGLFTTDDAVKELAEVIWLDCALFNLNVAVFALCAGVATGLGKQWPLGVINFVYLFLFGLPVIYYTAVVQGQGLDAAWFWMNIPYLCMNVTLIAMFVFTDWYKIQEQILITDDTQQQHTNESDDGDPQRQGGTAAALANETTSLL